MLSEFDLSGQVAIVTGGGTGIGRAIALLLAERGADVALAARRADKLEAVAQDIRALGRRALCVPSDVRDPHSVQAMVGVVVA
ncbi:MAG TPA: SDR family NAD(P)-dependent oxidoreductase, partial [Novosphingobium sp.]|nr:SDR family NAD(P)-dependent oxidoreductase [Novosphingobium sp.]